MDAIRDEYRHPDPGEPLLPEEYIVGAWGVYDANTDGVLSMEEFLRFLAVVRHKATGKCDRLESVSRLRTGCAPLAATTSCDTLVLMQTMRC